MLERGSAATRRADTSSCDVPAFHARKMTAALQAASASDRAAQPTLLRIDRTPSEPGALFDLELRDLVDQRIFLGWQLGMQ